MLDNSITNFGRTVPFPCFCARRTVLISIVFFPVLYLVLIGFSQEKPMNESMKEPTVKPTIEPMREQILDALERGLQFMEDSLNTINLDAIFGVRYVAEQLTSYLEFESEVFEEIHDKVKNLSEKADKIANTGAILVRKNDPEYFSIVGSAMSKSRNIMWYPSLTTDSSFVVTSLPCNETYFDGDASNTCLNEVCGTEKDPNTCIRSPECVDMTTTVGQAGYNLTHQVLYWQLLEMKCLDRVSSQLHSNYHNYFCANVMRDAQQIAGARYPRSHRDLFMEQIGFCGAWGYKDFYNQEWLSNILNWQQENGCFIDGAYFKCSENLQPDPVIRTQRREKVLKDGCLSHKTTVGLLAIAVSLRFEQERIYSTREQTS